MNDKTVLVTGVAGGLARLAARRMRELGYEVIGVDYRKSEPFEFDAKIYRASYNKTAIEGIFRQHEPTHVLHLGRVGDLSKNVQRRFELNVLGGQKLMELCVKFGARRLVVLSTFHIYGAHPHNHVPIAEHEPIRAGAEFPEIADAIQLDNQAVVFAYQHPGLRTAVLRTTNVVGPDIQNTMCRMLRKKRLPVVMGFDPMTQVVDQDDLVDAIVATAQDEEAVGVFNVAAARPVPWRTMLDIAGARRIHLPSTALHAFLRLRGLMFESPPAHLIDFFRFPCVISEEKLRNAVAWQAKVEPEAAIARAVGRA